MRVRPSGCVLLSVLAAWIVGGAGPASAQAPDLRAGVVSLSTPPSTNLLRSGLLDFSRVDVSHSVAFGFSSGSGQDRSGGLWVTQLGYRISNPLRVAVDIGAVLDPSGSAPFLSEKSVFLKGFNLDYRPSKHFLLNVTYVNLPSNAAPALGLTHPGLGPYWGSPLGLDR